MKSKTRVGIQVLWQTVGLLLFLTLGFLLLNSGYKHYYSAVYPMHYQTEVIAASDEYGIEPSLIYAIIHTESSFEPRAVSPANAKGLMQLTDDTFRWALTRAGTTGQYTSDDLFDPATNIRYGVYVLTLLGEQFENTETVLAAYNAGQGRVGEWLDDPQYSADGVHLDTIPYAETKAYVQRVLDAQERYQQLYSIQ